MQECCSLRSLFERRGISVTVSCIELELRLTSQETAVCLRELWPQWGGWVPLWKGDISRRT